jgi:hypothetical protein
MKYELTYLDGCGDFREMQKTMWDISRDVRTVQNKTIQMWADWDFRSRKNFEETGAYLDCLEETGQKQFRGYAYAVLKNQFNLLGSNVLTSAINKADKKYKNCRREVLRGKCPFLPTSETSQFQFRSGRSNWKWQTENQP